LTLIKVMGASAFVWTLNHHSIAIDGYVESAWLDGAGADWYDGCLPHVMS